MSKERRSTISSGRLHDLPRVIVFDLDNTLWSPELYTLRKLQSQNLTPIAGKDVKMFDAAIQVLDDIIPNLNHNDDNNDDPPMLAIASRTQSVDWAHDLIDQFDLRDRFSAIEIFPAHKSKHFANIQRQTRVPFHEMMFFDDARDGKYGNCEPIAAMGVFCVHCPQGIVSPDIFERALHMYRNDWDKSPNCIVEWDGRLTTNNVPQYQKPEDRKNKREDSRRTFAGVVKMVRPEKNYGFIRFRKEDDQKESRDIFFHFNNLAGEDIPEEGDAVNFQIQRDSGKSKKDMAVNVVIDTRSDKSTVQMQCFSMNQPFAALLANGYKTLETRNGTMFTQYAEGTQMLLHVGSRTYPDGGKHIEIMKEAGLSDDEIEKLKSLPDGFSRGTVVAILEIGKTYETTTAERSGAEFERNVVARGSDSGKFVTEIRRVAYLKKPIRVQGARGVFKIRIDPDLIPDDGDWKVPPALSEQTSSGVYASISG